MNQPARTLRLLAMCLAGALDTAAFAQAAGAAAAEPPSIAAGSIESRTDLGVLIERELSYLAGQRRVLGNSATNAAERRRVDRRQAALSALKAEVQRDGPWTERTVYYTRDAAPAGFAAYVDEVKAKIETQGSRHFPKANGKALHGDAVLLVRVNKDGEVLDIEVARESDEPGVNAHAVDMLRLLGPFKPFTAEMREVADYVCIPLPFRYSREAREPRPARQAQ